MFPRLLDLSALHEPPPLAAFLEGGESRERHRGTHRVVPLETTSAIAERAARGIGVTRVSDITGLDTTNIPTFAVVLPTADEGAITVLNGKGTSELAARVSGLMEAIERYSGQRNGREPLRATVAEARALGAIIEPRRFILRAGAAYDDATELWWWSARHLRTGECVLVPAQTVFVPFTAPPQLLINDTTGLAAGNSRAEALLHALFEVIERDATAFGEALVTGERLELDSIDDPTCRSLVERLRGAGLELHVHALSSGVDVPTFHVIADDVERRDPMFINGGFGCHLSPRIALSRALTEAAQSRATVIAGAREDLEREAHRQALGYDGIKEAFAPLFDPSRKTVRFQAFPDRSSGTIRADLERVLLALDAAGLSDVLAVDLTAPETGVPVVRALVPGAENVHTGELLAGPRLLRALRARSRGVAA